MTYKPRIYIRDYGVATERMLVYKAAFTSQVGDASFRRALRIPVINEDAGEPGLLISEIDPISGLPIISDDLLLLTGEDGYLVLTTSENFRTSFADARLRLSFASTLRTGDFVLAGSGAQFFVGQREYVDAGTFALTGIDVPFTRRLIMDVNTGGIALAGGESEVAPARPLFFYELGNSYDVSVQRSSASFLDAADGGTTTASYSTSSEILSIGIVYQSSDSNFYIDQTLLAFNLQDVPGSIRSASLLVDSGSSFRGTAGDPIVSQTFEVRMQDPAVTSISLATAFQTATQLETLPFLGARTSTSGATTFNVPVAHALLPRVGDFLVNVAPTAQRTRTAPASFQRLQTYQSSNLSPSVGPRLLIGVSDPWRFVGAGASSVVTTASQTLTEPSGTEASDLLVAFLSIRSTDTRPVILPSGWQLATSSYINNVVADSASGASSGLIAYTIRGASAPALTFTHQSAPALSIGQIVAYRNNVRDIGSVLDVAGATRMGAAATAISVPGITTTLRDTLIVSAICGGRPNTVTAFNNATAGFSSGTSSAVTTRPEPLRWRERADTSSATGPGSGLALFDCLRSRAGATGNFSATASASGIHLVLSAAFKMLP